MNHQLLIPRRRAGDWVGSLLAYSPIALYAADRGLYSDAGTTLAVATDPVYQWNDQSGNAKHLTQSTLASRPTLTASYQNGKPAVVWDGVDDLMLSVALTSFPSKRGGVFAVIKNTLAADYGIVCGTYTIPAISWFAPSPITGTAYGWFDNAALPTTAAFDTNAATLKAWHRDGDTSLKHRRNGAASDTLVIGDNQPTSASVLAVGSTTSGGVAVFKGGIMALALFPDLTLAQVQAIEAILNATWAVY